MTAIWEIAQFMAESVWAVWPLFLLSIVLSVLIRALKLDGLIRRAFQANVGLAILLATFVGAFSPFCACTVVPVIAGLLMSGVPLAPIMSFWIASPTMDPEIFTLSVGILGWPLALVRLGATLVLSLLAGYITLALSETTWLRKALPAGPQPATPTPPPADPPVSLALAAGVPAGTVPLSTIGLTRQSTLPTWHNQIAASFRSIEWPAFGREVLQQSWSLGRWLLLAFLLEALITGYVPQAAIAGVLGESNALAVPLAALIGVPLYLNNFGALPIVAGLLAQGMQVGAAIAFLIAGPVTTIPALTAVYGIVERRIFALYVAFGLLGAVVMGLATNAILG